MQAEGCVQRGQVADRAYAAVDLAERHLGLVAEGVVGDLILLGQRSAVDVRQARQFGALVRRQLPGVGLALGIDEDGPGREQPPPGQTQRIEYVVGPLAFRRQQDETLAGVHLCPRRHGRRCVHHGERCRGGQAHEQSASPHFPPSVRNPPRYIHPVTPRHRAPCAVRR